MDEQSLSALQYGHLGRAIYYSKTQSWEFGRKISRPPCISYTGVTKISVPSPLTTPQASLIENKSILRDAYPELAASWPFIENETLSHVISITSEFCDPLVASLLDLGHAVNLENSDSGNRVVSIAAVASGECGNAISFRRIEDDPVEMRQETPIGIRVPSIGNTESTEWCAGKSPVRQICFARTIEEKATWMAARFHQSTAIFRPLYHRHPVPGRIYHDSEHVRTSNYSNSRLNANLVVEISHLQTGGFAHADVTFNPWYQKQFALVDERGNWSIWEISGRQGRTKSSWTTACIRSGSLPWLDLGDGQGIDGHPRHDGWAAIEWAADLNTFIVSDRRCPILYRIRDNQIYPFAIELDLSRKSEWILDVKRSPCNVSHIFILTTTRVFWLDLVSEIITTAQGDTRPSLYPRISWKHFRDPEDTTLRLTPLLLHEDLYIIMYSRLNNLALAFHCSALLESDIHPVTIAEPSIIEIPLTREHDHESRLPPNIAQISSLIFREIAHIPVPTTKDQYNPSARLIKLFAANSRLSICESIFSAPGNDHTASEQEPGKDVLRQRRRYAGGQKDRPARFRNGFIVDDWDDSVQGVGTPVVPGTGISSITPLAIPQWTIDCRQVYAVAIGEMMIAQPQSDSKKTTKMDLHASIQYLRNKLSVISRMPDFGQTMLEVLGESPVLDDIDQNAQELDDFLSTLTSDGHSLCRFAAQPLVLESSPNLRPTTTLNLVDLYDMLANDWLASLTHNIPGRTRIVKEKAIRSVAADLVLTQVMILHRVIGSSERVAEKKRLNDTWYGDNADYGFDENGRSRSPQSTNAPGHDNGLDAAGSAVVASTGSAKIREGTIEIQGYPDPLYSHLSNLTTFNGKRSRPQKVAKMLQHWQPGADPDGYEWLKAVQVLETDGTRPNSTATTPKRRLRRKSSHGTVVDSSAPTVSSEIPSLRDWASQPDNPGRSTIRYQSSSQIVDEDLPMTQIERGAFGGREAAGKNIAKARKKRRAAGF